MTLTKKEQEKLLLSYAAVVARKRLDNGLKLNCPEAIAIISDYVMEGARAGKSVSDLMNEGKNVLRKDQVMEGVADIVNEVQIEATFKDGTKLVTIHNPIN
ncbi:MULTISPECIES: urease subunit gamma [unclassified Campylobacter]|uniref:urease subunit gamma n=1 Tax=unclassified Campylobacter TaxID=2593542 RepID=UPI001BDAA9C5|nr:MULTISPECIES: urease subunit gamma [unclassified Campylobacter]MBZ7975493.1 urease subunit gamma [Campylobacter sp. RM12637]MBZ7978776.1 urease subunit gamma [Campylobacter sp. RM12654]MBZ7980607.1 urease subunit gamma [Campylobacter sp. RM12642]MBZ7982606.1 urease subunit gamma [Campylobacter sp. RM12640]MBZ7984451.1 urease subunit gamma [Campylobacter sp. RM12647]MBZ7989868.1 urease subunit gamma [Campylobacter sp. RM12635]MBZ7991931.1 urease subunit gamma [Campylobacter sp. RM9331]MBZ